MRIPPLGQHGLLPIGVHDCTFNEIKATFSTFQGSDRRHRLFAKLEAFVIDARASRIVRSVLVDGSFVTAKPDPNDIDLVLVLPLAHDLKADLSPAQYNLVSRRSVQNRYGFDMVAVRENTREYDEAVAFFPASARSGRVAERHLEGGIMIENTDQLQQAIEQMGRMQRILESYRADILPKNPRNFAVFAEGPLDEIRKLQAEIDQYITRLEQVTVA